MGVSKNRGKYHHLRKHLFWASPNSKTLVLHWSFRAKKTSWSVGDSNFTTFSLANFPVSKIASQYFLYWPKPRKSKVWLVKLNPFEKYARQSGFIFPNFQGENKKKWVATTWKCLAKSNPPLLQIPSNPKKGCVFSKAQGLQCRRYSDAPGFFFWKGQDAQQQWASWWHHKFSLKKNLPSGKRT